MGAYLDTPITEKNPEHGENSLCSWGACSMQGWRCSQEDAHVATEIDIGGGSKGMLFCCFDGHGGKEVAQFAQQHFANIFQDQPEFKTRDFGKALNKTFFALDKDVSNEDFAQDTGSTSCVIFFTNKTIYCANAGDSRAVLSTGSSVIGLSQDHKPDNAGELKRIEAAKHFVEDSRVDGNLALSRAFGDFQYKDKTALSASDQAVTCLPDVFEQARSDKDKFIILACDGIWDCLSNEECVQSLDKKLKTLSATDPLSNPVEKLLEEILAPNTDEGIGTDNMTAILIKFKNGSVGSE